MNVTLRFVGDVYGGAIIIDLHIIIGHRTEWISINERETVKDVGCQVADFGQDVDRQQQQTGVVPAIADKTVSARPQIQVFGSAGETQVW